MRIFDISREMTTAVLYPGSCPVALEKLCSMAAGDSYNLSAFSADLHAGTHVDAPLHFIDGAADIASVPLSRFFGPCHVIELTNRLLTAESLLPLMPQKAEKILLKNSVAAVLTPQCAQMLAERNITTLGTENLSVAPFDNEGEIHTILLSANIAIIESLDLSHVEAGEYFLSAAPIKIKGAEAAYARAVLICFE